MALQTLLECLGELWRCWGAICGVIEAQHALDLQNLALPSGGGSANLLQTGVILEDILTWTRICFVYFENFDFDG